MGWLHQRWSYGLTLLIVCWFGWICIYLTKSVIPPLLPVLMAEWGMSHTQAGMLETAYVIGYVVVKVPASIAWPASSRIAPVPRLPVFR